MKFKFLIRLDDFTPGCCIERWEQFVNGIHQSKVLCIVGIIPDNLDKTIISDNSAHEKYLQLLTRMNSYENFIFAQHGYSHVISNIITKPYLPPFERSEFSDKESIVQILLHGRSILRALNIDPNIYMAPAHGISYNHIQQIKQAGFSIITDGFSFRPYIYCGVKFIPQQLWKFRRLPLGLWTICYHPNNMSISEVSFELNKILLSARHGIGNFDDLAFIRHNFLDRLFRIVFSFLIKYVKN